MIDRDAVQRKRGLRPDAVRFIRPDAQRYFRPDAARFLSPGSNVADVFLAFKYSPTQRRIPAGLTGGGRWTRDTQTGGGSGGLGSGGGGSVGEDGAVDVSAIDLSDVNITGVDLGDSALAFDTPEASDPWASIIGSDWNEPRPIPNANAEDIPANLDEVNSRRGSSPNSYFPGATTQQLVRLDQAIARSANAQVEIRQYDFDWRPTQANAQTPGSIEGTIGTMEARAAEAEARLDQLRHGIGGNRPPPITTPWATMVPTRPFDGGAWIDADQQRARSIRARSMAVG